jgi:aminobenzoyl-glutamate utilization protein B
MRKIFLLIGLCSVMFLPSVLCAQQPPALPALKQEAAAEVDGLETLTQQMVDQIFSFSELGFQEVETSRYVTGILEKYGFQVERSVAGIPTAWVATYGHGKPVIAFITDLDCIPRASQKPGVAYHAPIIEGAPGHGEGHNSGMAVNVTAALVLKKLMDKNHLVGTIRLLPGVAEELLGTKAFYVRDGLFKDTDIVLGAHVSHQFATSWLGLCSVFFPWKISSRCRKAVGRTQRSRRRFADECRLGIPPRAPAAAATIALRCAQRRGSA